MMSYTHPEQEPLEGSVWHPTSIPAAFACECEALRELRAERDRLAAEWDAAYAALAAFGAPADSSHPTAVRYREASDAVNHANRRVEAAAWRVVSS